MSSISIDNLILNDTIQKLGKYLSEDTIRKIAAITETEMNQSSDGVFYSDEENPEVLRTEAQKIQKLLGNLYPALDRAVKEETLEVEKQQTIHKLQIWIMQLESRLNFIKTKIPNLEESTDAKIASYVNSHTVAVNMHKKEFINEVPFIERIAEKIGEYGNILSYKILKKGSMVTILFKLMAQRR